MRAGRSRVAIVKGKDPSKMVKKAVNLLELGKLCLPGEDVVIKPNYVFAKPPSTGITTDSRIIESLANLAKANGAEVTVAEGGAGDTERAFDVVGIREITSRLGVPLVNLNTDQRVKVRITDGMALKEVGIAFTALRCSSIINVPKLKVHSMALVTLSLKNLMGFILPKSMMHSRIDEKIVDLAGLLRDKVKVSVVDGLVGAEVNESHGDPVNMGLLIAGRDMVAVDAVGASIMGIEPMEVGYIRLASERGLGAGRLADIEILGEGIEEVARPFERPPRFRNLR